MLGVQGERYAEKLAVGRYRIVSQLGQGGTADVYLAFADGPAGFRKLVVLKILRKKLTGDDDFRAMFLSEARLSARLHHPNIVQTNEVLDADGTPVIVMEYLEGQPLSQVIVRGRDAGFTQAMQLRVLIDALHGLHAAHELADFDGTPLGVVHRDVSPQNIFVTLEGQAKVLDFGIAKIERSIVETEVGTIKGKLRYMAAEQIAGEKLSRRADIYAAGVVLWEALAGERMWKGCSEADIRARVLRGDLSMPETVRADVPPVLARICRRALSLSPADRHATALEFADDLEAALPELGKPASQREIGATIARLFEDVRALTKGALERVSKTDLAILPPHEVPEKTSVPDRRGLRAVRGRVLFAAGGVATLVLGAAFFVAWRNRDSLRPKAPDVAPAARKMVANTAETSVARPADLPQTVPEPTAEGGVRRTNPRNSVPGRLWPKRAQRPAASAESGTGAAGRDCDHPFFFDANGIKKFRPECM
jgi:serine/threonine protein kinase